MDYFSWSHGITKESALTCVSCHSATDSVIDWAELGYDENPRNIAGRLPLLPVAVLVAAQI